MSDINNAKKENDFSKGRRNSGKSRAGSAQRKQD